MAGALCYLRLTIYLKKVAKEKNVKFTAGERYTEGGYKYIHIYRERKNLLRKQVDIST